MPAEATAEIAAAAQALAKERNTCTLGSVAPTVAFGKPALAVTVHLAPRTRPDSRNEQYDRFGMDVTLTDQTGNLVSSVAIFNETHRGEPYQQLLSGNPGDGPDSNSNTATIIAPVLSRGSATYSVFRQNAVSAKVAGTLVSDTLLSESG